MSGGGRAVAVVAVEAGDGGALGRDDPSLDGEELEGVEGVEGDRGGDEGASRTLRSE